MELSSAGPPEKLNNLNKADSSPHKEKDEHVNIKATEVYDLQEQMVQRCVIIQKDEKGYGLTVSGDNPVFVQSVKEDGAAARAGVQQGDRIIKVNGTLVTQSNHQDVVELIKSGSYVALTLLGKPPGHGRTQSCTLQPLNISGSNASSHSVAGKLSSPSERITGPQPVDPEKQQQLTNSRIMTIRKMLEKEVTYLENLKLEYSKSPSEKIHSELNGAVKRVKTLEEQLVNLTGVSPDHIIPKSPKSPPAPHLHRHYHSEKENRHSMTPTTHLARSLTHQVSAPSLPPKPDHLIANAKAQQTTDLNSPPSVPSHRNSMSPDSFSKPSLSASLESIEKQMTCRTTTWPQGATHTRQSSSPDHLMKHAESVRHQKNAKAASDLFRSHSEVSQLFRKSPVSDTVPNAENKSFHQHHHLPTSRDTALRTHESSTESPMPSPPHSPAEYAEIQDVQVEGTEDDGIHEEYGTPPETNPAEINIHSVIAKLGQTPSIICMEDDEFSSDTELSHLDDHGPFSGLWKLVRNPAHLAVFMNYLMSNGNSSSLFFYLISDLFEQGTAREMKKWAYEIHSSFLVPGAPLKVVTVDEGILHEIDDVLLHHVDKEETLRTVFRKARKKAREEINDMLAEFRNKRTMGLINMFSPPDYQLEEAMHDKNKELKLIEQVLSCHYENITEDFESMNDTLAATTFALVTILKNFGLKSPQVLNLCERCPTFVAKEKSRIRFLQRKEKVVFVQGHHFLPEHYYSVTYCNHCQLIIWGVGNQGYQCQNCTMNIHKSCVKVVEEHCIGALRNKKDKRKDRMSGIVEFIGKSRKPSQPVPAAIEKAKKLNEDMNLENEMMSINDSSANENHDAGDKTDAKDQKISNDNAHVMHLQNKLDKTHFNKKNAAAGIGRSESFRQRRESRPSFRKRSDPNIPRSKSDVEVDDRSGGSNLNNSGSSSNSSLSNRSLDSPSTSSDMVHRTPTATLSDNVPQVSVATANVPSPLAGTPSTATTNNYDDSDLEADVDPPRWQDNIDDEVLRLMKPKEKKRQDVINELFHTERNHVRNLKVLDRIFYRPLLQEQLLPPDFLQLLFPNLEEMIEIHSTFNNRMKALRKEEPVIGNIGPMLLEMFDGTSGEHLKGAAVTFCQNYSVALESLKNRQKKDQKLAQFLADAELHNLCRRLQFKDIIASGFQRLTKYPLLLENIAKYTPPNTDELNDVQRAVECSREINYFVDSAVKEAVNLHRLSDIHKKLDKSAFDKVEHPIVHSFKNLDVTKHRLIHEGPLTWRLGKQKTIDVHVLLLEEALLLLQKQDEKYMLKFHSKNLTTSRDDTKIMHSPIIRLQNLLIRNNAADKKSIILVSPSPTECGMYEFAAATTSEKKTWCRYLTEAVEISNTRAGPVRQPELFNVGEPEHAGNAEESHPDESVNLNKEAQSKEDMKEKKLSTESMDSVTSARLSSQPSADSVEASNAVICGDNISSESTLSPTSPDDGTSNAELQNRTQKRLQRVEILKIADGPQLIEPCEVIVSQGAVLQTAEPVLTPIERLRRKDQEISAAMQEKEKLVSDILQVPAEDVISSIEFNEDVEGKNAQELIASAVYQANQLSVLLNECLNATVEEASMVHNNEDVVEFADSISVDGYLNHNPSAFKRVPKVPLICADKLMTSSTSLNKKLTHLLAMITESEKERQQLRNELGNVRDQIHLMHETHRHCSLRSRSPSNVSASQSRPNSFVSITSSMSEDTPDVIEEQQQLSSVLNRVVEESSPENSAVELCPSDSTVAVGDPDHAHNGLPSGKASDEKDVHSAPADQEVLPSKSSMQPENEVDCDSKEVSDFACTTAEVTDSGKNCSDAVTESSSSVCEQECVSNSVDPIYF